jgi:hypothetical protein
MISNVERLAKALLGNNPSGRVLNGMSLAAMGGNNVTIFEGQGVTRGGNIISLASMLQAQIPATAGTHYIYLKYVLVPIDGGSDVRGRNTSFLGGPNKTRNIVYDEIGIVAGGSINSEPFKSAILSVESTQADADDRLLVGYAVSNGTSVTSVVMNDNISINGTLSSGTLGAGSAAISGNASVGGNLSVTGTIEASSAFSGTYQGSGTLTIVKGIVTSYTPAP